MKSDNLGFWKKRRVLITGYAGFLGSWLTKKLLELDARIVGVDIKRKSCSPILKNLKGQLKGIQANVVDFKSIDAIINKSKPEVVFHLAAQAIVQEAVRQPLRTFKSNIEGTWNILEACRDKKFIQAIVVASSDKAYGAHKKLPYKEGMPLQGRFPYDVSKSCADLLAYSYFKTYGLPVCVTRCGNIFGPGDLHFCRIIPDALRSVIKERNFIIRSDGKFTRDYIYVDDIVRGYLILAEKLQTLKLFGEAFNFSNEKPISVLELVEVIYESINKKPNYKILNQAKYEIKNQYLSSKKARKILGWKPKYTLDEGLKKTIQWYRDYFNNK